MLHPCRLQRGGVQHADALRQFGGIAATQASGDDNFLQRLVSHSADGYGGADGRKRPQASAMKFHSCSLRRY